MKQKMIQLLNCSSDRLRKQTILDFLEQEGIEYETDSFFLKGERKSHARMFSNIYCKGNSSIYLVAHYDTVTPSLSANDNTASVINAIAIKKALPWVNIAFLDGEEAPCLGKGSTRMAEKILSDELVKPSMVLNLELTGRGQNWYVGTRGTDSLIKSLHSFKEVSLISTPFSDTDRFLEKGIPSIVLFTIPEKKGKHDTEIMYYCHTKKDNITNINFIDMGIFVTTMITYLIGVHNVNQT